MLNQMKINQKIFFSDVDDTLIDERGITQQLKEMINRINQNNDYLVPCSGRPTQNLINTFKNYKVDYVIGFNGGEIYDINNDEFIFQNSLNQEDILKIVPQLEQNNIDYLLYDQYIYTNNVNNEYAKIEEELCNIKLKAINDIQSFLSSGKILGLCNPDKTEKIIKKLKIKLPDYEISISKPFFIEITKKNINKALSLKKLQQKLKITNNDTYCFGDGLNDMSMFECSNINKIAVDNAHEELKKKATKIVDSCHQDGVIKFINSLYRGKNE